MAHNYNLPKYWASTEIPLERRYMNTTLIDFQAFVEWDNNPFILFSAKGKILYLNNAAEILFGYVSKQELYDILLLHQLQLQYLLL